MADFQYSVYLGYSAELAELYSYEPGRRGRPRWMSRSSTSCDRPFARGSTSP